MTASNSDHSAICTKLELLRRLRDRDEPNSAPALNMPGDLGADVRRRSDEERRSRIAKLQHALEKAHGRLEKEQAFARLDGYAKAQFSKDR